MREPIFDLSLAGSDDDIAAAQRLRYKVFVEELGGNGPLVDHAAKREKDRFDDVFDHLILRDMSRPEADRVVGVYRVMTGCRAAEAGSFYSEAEYDLSALRSSRRRLMELGRSCVHPAYRGGPAMVHLWSGLAAYVERHGAELLFGVASFRGTDPGRLAAPLSILHHRHLAPAEIRPVARAPNATPMDILDADRIDRIAAMRAVPALIKGYLRMGGVVGQGAWIDREFNTTDVCLVMDTARLAPGAGSLYRRSPR